LAVAIVAASSPGMDGETHAALVYARTLPARMPGALPADEISRDLQLVAVNIRARGRESDVPQHKIQRIHVELGSSILKGAHGNEAALRMVWRSPCARWANIGGYGSVLLAHVGYVEHIRHGRRSASAWA